MRLHKLITIICLLAAVSLNAQQRISIDAKLQPQTATIEIGQQIEFYNNSKKALQEIYLLDWANSFSSKTTPLGKRFSENYDSQFHFEKDKNRGRTDILTIENSDSKKLEWEYGDAVDIIKVNLDNDLLPGETYTLSLKYNVKQPDAKFTRYGVTKENNFILQYWYISPAVHDETGWHFYSNKNTEDLYMSASEMTIQFEVPSQYYLTSDLNVVSETVSEGIKTTTLNGKSRIRSVLYVDQKATFESVVTDEFEIVTDIHDDKVTPPIRALVIDRIVHFLSERMGPYPFEKMVISEVDYRSSPVYGLNQLPDFISPFPDGFEYDMEQLKTITRNYIENTLLLNPREDYWLSGALQIHFMMEYVNIYYPKMKIIGSLSDFWIIRWAHAADLEFNDQYPLLYLNMARNNLHQKLTTPKDSLLKFNKNIANDYYGGQGLTYLSDYLGDDVLAKSIKQLYSEKKLGPIKISDFEKTLEQNTELPINWFFEDYANKRSSIDFKITSVKKKGDSLKVNIKNLRENSMPVSIFGLDKKEVLFKKWTFPISDTASITLPAAQVRKLVLNYDGIIPEFNRRNNYKKVKGLLNKPVQFRLFQDVEDPNYTQFFFMPIFEYNLYDGVSAGLRLYNKTVLPKGIVYSLEPQFGFRSKNLVGRASISYTDRKEEGKLYAMRYGISGNYYSYDTDLFYKTLTPYITFAFRNKDLRDNEKQFINIRSINVSKDDDPNELNQDPNYSVFNLQYVYSNPNLINYFRGSADYELSSRFSKIFVNFEYRKLFNSNRQLNLRLFAGTFLFNDTGSDGNFFSFALDRPTDYLFKYSYYGRSEDQGLFSQQLIVAEGGFKSQLEPAFSNTWMTTLNASTNIWKWIHAYGDVGLINNKGVGTKAVFDTGIRVNLVADYFELYFPVYSSLGFEPNLPHYDEKVRFVVTLSPKTLLRLFTREWY
ncbi:gluzincin family metallopeptidase [Ulvibacter antarcticus]|uniref:Peptidase M1 membrane alanine aminopeptidase domain-containing protein n=1 Tax=Ulvibacter antarcticus TaxID=442714 RepID=A0A3L9YHI3_9FLAO|nr:metalloprotease [Ulvibacter antarcticus]RMA58920.1 hypothetical protein BXY75_2302 [Ulvibacter antarcticus]